MRFRLIEAPDNQQQKQIKSEWPPSQRTLKSYDKLSTTDEQIKFIEERILPHRTFKHLYGVRPIIIDSIQKHGLNPQRNFFLNFIANLNIPMPNAESRPKLQYIYNSFLNKKMDLHMPVLQNPSLYDRTDREFQYTLNAFTLLSDPRKASSYIKDTSVININELLINGNNPATSTIKPAGLNGGKGDTIFNVIERWAKGNEYSPEEIANNKNKSNDYTSISSIIKNTKYHNYKYFANIIDSYYPEVDIDIDSDSLHLMLYTAFTLPNIESICNNTLAQMLVDVKQGLQNEITPSELKPQEDVFPGTLIHTPNVKDDPVSLYFFHNIVTLTKNDKFIANSIEDEANYLQDIILDAPTHKVNNKDRAEVGKEIIKAIANAYKTNNVAAILNNIWQEKIV